MLHDEIRASCAEREITYETIPFTDEAFPIRVLPDLVTRRTVLTGPPRRISWHEQMEFLYVLEGSLICECDFHEYRCRAGDVVVINPCEPHAVYYDGTTARYHCVMIDTRLCSSPDDAAMRRFIDPITDRRVRFRHVLQSKQAAAHILDELVRETERADQGYELAVKGDLLRLIAHLYRYETTDSALRHNAKQAISPALRYIADHYAQSIPLSALAAACCMNESYFCRRFRACTGRTAVRYLNEYRLTKAKALLLTTEYSVAEIAAATGFDDSSYFTRKFKEFYHISPTGMRNDRAAGTKHEEDTI